MNEQANIKIARAFFEAANAHDLDRVSSVLADGCLVDQPSAPAPLNKAQVRTFHEGFYAAFPDLRFEVTRTIAEGDYVVLNWTFTGTHSGPMRTPSGKTIPPSSKKAVLPGSSTFEIKDDKITRGWVHMDMASLLSQLGILPPM